MEKLKLGELLLHYLREKRKEMGLFLLCVLVFFTVCLMYQLDNLPKLLYGFYLCIFISLCYGIDDFVSWQTEIMNSYTLNFFDRNLKGNPAPLLGVPTSKYAEVTISVQ